MLMWLMHTFLYLYNNNIIYIIIIIIDYIALSRQAITYVFYLILILPVICFVTWPKSRHGGSQDRLYSKRECDVRAHYDVRS